MKQLLPGMPVEAMDLVDRMLDLNPLRRITVEESLKHEFLGQMHDEEDEPVFEGEMEFGFEVEEGLNVEKLKRLILKEVAEYNK